MFNITKQVITQSEIRDDSPVYFFIIYLIQEREEREKEKERERGKNSTVRGFTTGNPRQILFG
jgi:hypothetical protein